MTDEHHHQITVTASEDPEAAGGGNFLYVKSVLERGLLQHLQTGTDWFQTSHVSIDVTDCRFEEFYSRIEVSASGTINDTELPVRTFAADVSAPVSNTMMAGAAGGMLGAAVQDAVDAALEKMKTEDSTPHPSALDQRILFQILEYLDETVGRTDSPSGLKWRKIMKLRWLAAAGSFLVILILGLIRSGVLAGAMFGALAAPVVFLIVHCWGLFSMPEPFFTTETAGKKALVMAGVGSVRALKVVVVVAMLFLLVCLAAAVIMVWQSANWN